MWHFLRLGLQNGDIFHIFLHGVFQKSKILQKAVSGRWCIHSNPLFSYDNIVLSGQDNGIVRKRKSADCTNCVLSNSMSLYLEANYVIAQPYLLRVYNVGIMSRITTKFVIGVSEQIRRFDTNNPARSLKNARNLKFWI